MFNKQELQLLGQTLTQRRNWLARNLEQTPTPDPQAQQTLKQIDQLLSKISAEIKGPQNLPDTVNHFISTKAMSMRDTAIKRRRNLVAEEIRVLIVDDDQLICELMRAYLENMGITGIDITTDGLKAINMIYEANPIYDLVLCDWNMPVKSGIEVHRAMHAAERYQASIFILVTAVAEAKQIRAIIESGIDDYVVKPIDQDKLLTKMASFFPKLNRV